MGQVTLNKNSWHFKYYSAVISDIAPKSLCPYFWTMIPLIIMSPFIGAILVFGFIMKHVTSYFDKTVPKKEVKRETIEETIERMNKESIKIQKRMRFWDKVGDVMAFTFKWIILPLLLIGLIVGLYKSVVKIGWVDFLILLGVLITTPLFIIGFVFLAERFGGRIGRFFLTILNVINPLNWKAVKILGEMIKTAYTKACPLITWEGETKTNERF